MKALLLAGGQGTRLRPLTIHTPKPIVPIFDRPFLYYQLDLVRQIPEIDEVILSLNYQPLRIEEIIGDGRELGLRIRYVVEPEPLGTAGAIKYAEQYLSDSVVVFNGDVLIGIDLGSVIRLHRERQARATIVLTPVENPAAYGLVDTEPDGRVRRFLEKPDPNEITCDTINAGIYVLEPDTFDRIPAGQPWSIERSYFPSLVERSEMFMAYIHRGYWIDIGTPAKYMQVHRDIMDGRFNAPPFSGERGKAVVADGARIEDGATVAGPCFINEGTVVKTRARVGPFSVIGRQCTVEEGALVDGAIVWPNTWIGRDADVRGAVLGHHCDLGRNVTVAPGVVLGDRSSLTDYSRVGC
jgi:NDP-sugar pyrophosphorylase family protein